MPPPSSVLAADSPAPVSAAPILRLGSFLASPSSDFGPHPALSPFLQGRRRAPLPAAASARRAAPPLPLLARSAAGEPRHHLCFAVRTFPGPLWPCFAVPPRAAAAVAARALARRAARVPWPRSRAGQGCWPCLVPAWWAAGPWAPPVGAWAGRLGCT